jgi:hypothetical protein
MGMGLDLWLEPLLVFVLEHVKASLLVNESDQGLVNELDEELDYELGLVRVYGLVLMLDLVLEQVLEPQMEMELVHMLEL